MLIRNDLNQTDHYCFDYAWNESARYLYKYIPKPFADSSEEICNHECLDDCHATYYSTFVTPEEEITTTDNDNSIIHFYVAAKQSPIMKITHETGMTFAGYLANVGGLAGVYLGISLIAIFEYVIHAFKYLQAKFKH